MLELKAWHAKKLTRRAFLKGLGSGLLAAGLDWNRTIFAQAQEELPIGILAPLVLDVGQSTVRGAELAAREINEAGGVLGRKIRLAVRDDQTSPQAAKLAFEDLVVNEGVVAILGEFLDEVMISLMPLIAQFKMPFIDTGSSMTATNEMVAQDYASYKYYFRAMFNTDILTMDMERVARDVFRDELGLKKVGLLLEEGIWGRDMQGFLEERLPQLGLSVTTVFFPLEQRDFGPMLTQLKDAGV
jgi:branched-chain amino acid transport system substrate-binding protein